MNERNTILDRDLRLRSRVQHRSFLYCQNHNIITIEVASTTCDRNSLQYIKFVIRLQFKTRIPLFSPNESKAYLMTIRDNKINKSTYMRILRGNSKAKNSEQNLCTEARELRSISNRITSA